MKSNHTCSQHANSKKKLTGNLNMQTLHEKCKSHTVPINEQTKPRSRSIETINLSVLEPSTMAWGKDEAIIEGGARKSRLVVSAVSSHNKASSSSNQVAKRNGISSLSSRSSNWTYTCTNGVCKNETWSSSPDGVVPNLNHGTVKTFFHGHGIHS